MGFVKCGDIVDFCNEAHNLAVHDMRQVTGKALARDATMLDFSLEVLWLSPQGGANERFVQGKQLQTQQILEVCAGQLLTFHPKPCVIGLVGVSADETPIPVGEHGGRLIKNGQNRHCHLRINGVMGKNFFFVGSEDHFCCPAVYLVVCRS